MGKEGLTEKDGKMADKIVYPKFNLDIPKIGYILAVRRAKKDFIGSKIERVQLNKGYAPEDAAFTHVEILSGGVDSMRIMPPKSKAINIQKFYKGRYVKILALDYEGFEEKYRYKIAALYNMLCNTKYDNMGILAFILPFFFRQDPNKPFCSEGVTESIRKVYPLFIEGKESHEVFPATIVSCPETYVKWEGLI